MTAKVVRRPVLTLANAALLREGFRRISFEAFTDIILASREARPESSSNVRVGPWARAVEVLAHQKVYAEARWVEFGADPILFCASRNPPAAGEELFELALRLGGFES